MVNRIDSSVSTAQTSSPVGKASQDKNIQGVAPIQAVSLKANTKSSDERPLPVEEAKEMLDSMNTFLKSANSQLKFQLHDELNEYYVTIVDSDTDEVIKEIPSRKLMDIHAAMREFVGLLVDRKI
ncbi:flagellar protein FlaG [Sporosarcina sp. CAU 1771]